MDTIKKISFLWKVLRGTLSIEEFSYLIGLVDTVFARQTAECRFAKLLLKLYFKGHLQQAEADVLINSNMSAQDLWVEAVRGKTLTDIELEMLVRRLPWYFTWTFPVQLSAVYLDILFAECNPEKIVAYCCDFSLPEEFEKKLLEKYRQSLTLPDIKMQYTKLGGRQINGWAEALEKYLRFGYDTDKRFASKDMQKKLLMIQNADLTNALIKRCSIARNILHEDVVWYLVEQHNEDALRLLMRGSYLPNIELLLQKIEREMPQLKEPLAIAQYRREIYLIEQKRGVFLGALSFFPYEHNIVCKYLETGEADKAKFAELYILPWLDKFRPCMCAYVAYHFPYLADKALAVTEDFSATCKR